MNLYDILAKTGIINDKVGEKDIVVFWAFATVSALNTMNLLKVHEVHAEMAIARLFPAIISSFRGRLSSQRHGYTSHDASLLLEKTKADMIKVLL